MIYLSHFLGSDTPFYGGEDTFNIEKLRSMNDGDPCNSSRWSFPNHAGTHVDLPLHFCNEGKSMVDYPANYWTFTNIGVFDISNTPSKVVDPDLLEVLEVAEEIEFLILKTGFGKFRKTPAYWQESPKFSPDLAKYLRDRFPYLRVLGFDTISISSWMDRPTGRKAHQAFLCGDAPILLLEDMDLTSVEFDTKFSQITVAPLLVTGADAAPCTVFAEVIV